MTINPKAARLSASIPVTALSQEMLEWGLKTVQNMNNTMSALTSGTPPGDLIPFLAYLQAAMEAQDSQLTQVFTEFKNAFRAIYTDMLNDYKAYANLEVPDIEGKKAMIFLIPAFEHDTNIDKPTIN
jgi:hypothetical protein